MEPLDENTLASMFEQQQQPQALVVKKEQQQQQHTGPGEPSKLLLPDQQQGLVVAGPSFEPQPQFLVKTESGETNFIIAPVSSQQSTILVYTAALPQQPAFQPPVMVPATEEGLVQHPVRLPLSLITSSVGSASSSGSRASAGPSVTITPTPGPRSSAAENLCKVTTIKNSLVYENPSTKSQYQLSPSVIVQSPQRQHHQPSSSRVYPTIHQNLVTTPESKKEFAPPAHVSHASAMRRSPQHVSALDQVTLSRLAAVASQEFESDSDYEKDVFSSDEDEEPRRSLLSNEPEVKFCEDERFQMEKLIKEHNDKYRSVNFGEELIKEMIMCSMFGIPVSTSAAISGYRLTVERITRIAHNLDCFTDLHKNDQATLLMENADLLVNLRGAIFFDSKNKGVNQILISMGIGK